VLDGNNGIFEQGETAQLSVTVKNFGYGNATGVTATLRCLTPGVTVSDSTATYGNLGTWVAGTSQAPHFTVQIGPGVSAGTLLEFRLDVRSTETLSEVSTFYDFVSAANVVYQNDFETSTSGWTHSYTQGADDWRWAAPRTFSGQWDPMQAVSGTKIFGNDLNETTGGTWDGLYGNSEANYLESPVINCTDHSGVYLSFRRWLTCEESHYDVARVLVNGTEIWRNAYSGHNLDDMWVPALYDIHDLADHNASVRVRFELTSDPGLHMGGWNLDDFRVLATDVPSGAVAGVPRAEGISLSAYPNPFGRLTGMELSVPGTGPALVQVFDAGGRLVRTLVSGNLEAGSHRILWTGTDETGRAVSAGTYFCRAQSGTEVATTRLVRLP
jgi:hypothetical protein